MIVKLDLTAWQALRNAFLLVALEWKRSLILLVLSLAFRFVTTLLYPYSILLLLLGAFSFLQLAASVIANDTINERLLKQDGDTSDMPDDDENADNPSE